MGLAFSQIDDAVLLTRNKLIKKKAFVDMQTDLTDHVAVREMWKGRRKVFGGGNNWEVEYQIDHNHSARTVGLYEKDTSNFADTMIKGEVPQRHVNAHYVYDQHEKAFQRGPEAIVDYVMTKQAGMMVSFYELLEEILWGKPANSADLKTPYGVAYWITRGATEGFTGGNPSGFSGGRAGIDSNTYTRFMNWSAQYTDITKTDLVRKMRKAAKRTKFRSPVSHKTPDLGKMGNGIYANEETTGLLEEILEASNMNLGNDLSGARPLFKGTPIVYAPYLDNDSTDPIYMLDWKWIAIGVLAGWQNNLSKPYMVPDMHNVRRVDLDATMNMCCTDPRRQAVFFK